MHWNGGLVEARHPNMHWVFSIQHTSTTDFFLKMWYDSIEKCFFRALLVANTTTSCPKFAWPVFHLPANKGVDLDDYNYFQDKPINRGYLSAWQTLLYAQGLMSELYFEVIASEIEK